MIARVLDIPDDDASMATWLDGQIVAPELHDFMAELSAVHGLTEPRRPATIREASAWLGNSLPAVLERGTVALDRRHRADLLRNPSLLPGLQELIFVSGGDHWREVVSRMNPRPGMAKETLLRRISGAAGSPSADRLAKPFTRRSDGQRRFATSALAALAAGILVAVATWSLLRPAEGDRLLGWNRPGVFASAAPDAYLDRLADAASEWSGDPVATELHLSGRLRSLLAACDRLLATPHETLGVADREWLMERCRTWRSKFAGQLAALDETHDVAVVRTEMTATVNKLVEALRRRADEIRGRS